MRHRAFGFLTTLAAAAAGAVLGGCGAAPEAAPATPRQAAIEVVAAPETALEATPSPARQVLGWDARRLAFSFVPAKGDEAAAYASNALRDAFARAGYQLVDEAAPRYDARLEVRIAQRQVSVALVRDREVVDWLATGIDDGKDLADLVDRLTASPRLASLVEAVTTDLEKSRRAGNQPAGPVAMNGTSESRSATLSEVSIRRCRNPRSADACDAVKAYVDNHPDGPHAAEARAALELSASKIERLRARGR